MMFAKYLSPLIALLLATPVVQAMDIQRWKTPNGSQVLLVEHHELPIVDYVVLFKGAGTIAAPEMNIAAATAGLLTQGTQSLTEEQFHEKISDLASSMVGGTDTEYSSFAFRSLSQADKLNATADLFNQALTQPRFDETALQRVKDQAILSLKQSESYPSYLADRELSKLNYPQHPYGAAAYQTAERIAAIKRQDLLDFHAKHYTQDGATIAIVGDITRPQAEALIARTLNHVPIHTSFSASVPPVTVKGGQRKNVPFSQSTQATIALGLPVLRADDPDYFAMLVGNYILGGGGFDGRLMKELRNKRGLTYGVSSEMDIATQAAPFIISLSTEKKNSAAALAATQKVLADFVAQGPTEAELQQAKAYLIGSFPLQFDNNTKLLGHLLTMAVYQRPDDWLDTYTHKIQALSTQDIKQAWQRKIQPSQMNIVVVGGQ